MTFNREDKLSHQIKTSENPQSATIHSTKH
jgi:hypothetical protein